MTKEKIKRINELSAKSKTAEGLNEAEVQEQKLLRQEYISEMRTSLKSQLNNVYIKQEDGSAKPLQKKHDKK